MCFFTVFHLQQIDDNAGQISTVRQLQQDYPPHTKPEEAGGIKLSRERKGVGGTSKKGLSLTCDQPFLFFFG